MKTLPAPKSPLPPGRALPAEFEVKDGRIACLKDRSEMVLVPEGTFPMGSETGDPDEKPVRQVTLSAYLIDRHEVTVAQYRAFCDAEKRTMPPQPGPELGPVVGVAWEEAAAYAAWAGKRLPTEAEWERAARGTDGRTFPWGNETTDYECNRKDRGDGFEDLAPVGSFKDDRSPADCFDMGGNAQEWCADWYAADAYAGLAPAVDPTGPLQGKKRVVRGGGANLKIPAARCSLRSYSPEVIYPHLRIGFRCAASLPK